MDKLEKNITHVPLNLPIDNQSFSFIIPPNTSDYTLNFGTDLPSSDTHHRWVSDITYRVDGKGLYNITTTEVVTWTNTPSGGGTITLEPGFYDVSWLIGLLGTGGGFLVIPTEGPGAYRARMASTAASANIPPQLGAIIGFPSFTPAGFVSKQTIDLTLGKDLLLVYASCVKQSQVNNKTNLCAIAIDDSNSVFIGNFHSKTPLLPSIKTADSVVIRLRDINDNPYLINTPIFLNIKMLFAKK